MKFEALKMLQAVFYTVSLFVCVFIIVKILCTIHEFLEITFGDGAAFGIEVFFIMFIFFFLLIYVLI